MYYKLEMGLLRAQELFIGGGRFSWGVGGFFSKIRNLGSRQSCLYNCLYKYKNGLQRKTITHCIIWSQRTELNRRPTDYESVALPLSYAGLTYFLIDGE